MAQGCVSRRSLLALEAQSKTSIYGSGYPGTVGRGVAGRGFPFYYWPLVWGGLAGYGGASYLHNNEVRYQSFLIEKIGTHAGLSP